MTTQPNSPASPAASRRSTKTRQRALLVLGVVLLIALVTWLVTKGGDDEETAAKGPEVAIGVPTILSESDLRAYGRAQGMPVYWAGPIPNRRYEVTHLRDGRYYVRYLTPKAEVGDDEPRFLTVGTYPGTNAYGALRTIGAKKNTSAINTKSGALVVIDKNRPQSVYFAFPNLQFQVEVFDPRASRARRVVLGGQAQRLR